MAPDAPWTVDATRAELVAALRRAERHIRSLAGPHAEPEEIDAAVEYITDLLSRVRS